MVRLPCFDNLSWYFSLVFCGAVVFTRSKAHVKQMRWYTYISAYRPPKNEYRVHISWAFVRSIRGKKPPGFFFIEKKNYNNFLPEKNPHRKKEGITGIFFSPPLIWMQCQRRKKKRKYGVGHWMKLRIRISLVVYMSIYILWSKVNDRFLNDCRLLGFSGASMLLLPP